MTLYQRLTSTRTLFAPKPLPDSRFALGSTVNWMHALALLVDRPGINANSARRSYADVSRREATPCEENTIFAQLLFALHQCSALDALRKVECKADVARVGIVAWYYGIYAAASAMVAAQAGSFQESHTKTADVWDIQIAKRQLIMPPFNPRISTLVKTSADKELRILLSVPKFNLNDSAPKTPDEALGACHAYLSGSVDYWRWENEVKVKESRKFRDLGVLNFQTKAARTLRDKRLSQHSIGFLHQAFRYRGKANYRDTLYLGYGKSVETTLAEYIKDLSKVLDAFVTCAGLFCSRRLGSELWDEFIEDVEEKRSFSASPNALWG